MGRPLKTGSHSAVLLKCAQTLWEEGHLLDTTVMTQGKTFKAHGLVLAAYSSYFKAIITTEAGPSNLFVLDNLELTSAAFKVILDYMYNGTLNVVEEDLRNVEHAAIQLQVESVVSLINKMKLNVEKIRQRQIHLLEKLERKRLRRLKREKKEQEAQERKAAKVACEDAPQEEDAEDNSKDEDIEDNPVAIAPLAEDDQMDMISEAWKAVGMATTEDEVKDDTEPSKNDVNENQSSKESLNNNQKSYEDEAEPKTDEKLAESLTPGDSDPVSSELGKSENKEERVFDYTGSSSITYKDFLDFTKDSISKQRDTKEIAEKTDTNNVSEVTNNVSEDIGNEATFGANSSDRIPAILTDSDSKEWGSTSSLKGALDSTSSQKDASDGTGSHKGALDSSISEKVPLDTSSSEKGISDSTSSQKGASDGTSSQKGASDSTSSQEGASDGSSSQKGALDSSSSEKGALESTSAQKGASDSTSSQEGALDCTSPGKGAVDNASCQKDALDCTSVHKDQLDSASELKEKSMESTTSLVANSKTKVDDVNLDPPIPGTSESPKKEHEVKLSFGTLKLNFNNDLDLSRLLYSDDSSSSSSESENDDNKDDEKDPDFNVLLEEEIFDETELNQEIKSRKKEVKSSRRPTRRRGRPPKVKKYTNMDKEKETSDGDDSPVPRNRGRRRRVVFNNDSDSNHSNHPNDSPSNHEYLDLTDNFEEGDALDTGRPRKIVDDDDAGSIHSNHSNNNLSNNLDLSDDCQEGNISRPRRKTRPRKVIIDDDSESNHSNDLDLGDDYQEDAFDDPTNENNDPKTGQVTVNTAQDSDTEAPAKRKRGRPKGSKNKPRRAHSPVLRASATPKGLNGPRKRGRPPGSQNKSKKRKENQSEDTTENPDEDKTESQSEDKLDSSMESKTEDSPGMKTRIPRRPKTKLKQEEKLREMFDHEANMFQCPECPYKTRTEQVFRLHRRRHTGYKPYPCQYCGKAFIDRKYLVPHERTHTGERPYKCDVCPSAFYDKKHFNRHMKRHTGTRDRLCSECGLAFYDNDTLNRHHAAVHLNIRVYKCKIDGCKFSANDAATLKEHKQQNHTGDPTTILCDLCGKTFSTLTTLRIHKVSHQDARFKCGHCSFIAHYKHVLRNHCLRLHGLNLDGTEAVKKVKCEECDFLCFTKQELHLHNLKKHLNERPHKCPVCNFATVDKGSLKKHLQTHTGVSSFECVCGKRFRQHSGYMRHYRTHTGWRPYKCSICDKLYADRKSLKTHLYSHVNARPYVCRICGLFDAVRQEHLKKHIVKKHGEEAYEDYKKKGLCKPVLSADDVQTLSENCIMLSDRDEDPQVPDEDDVTPTDLSQGNQEHLVILPAPDGQGEQPQSQQILMSQIKVYEDPNVSVSADGGVASHPFLFFTQAMQGEFTPGHEESRYLTAPPTHGHIHVSNVQTVMPSEVAGLNPAHTHPSTSRSTIMVQSTDQPTRQLPRQPLRQSIGQTTGHVTQATAGPSHHQRRLHNNVVLLPNHFGHQPPQTIQIHAPSHHHGNQPIDQSQAATHHAHRVAEQHPQHEPMPQQQYYSMPLHGPH